MIDGLPLPKRSDDKDDDAIVVVVVVVVDVDGSVEWSVLDGECRKDDTYYYLGGDDDDIDDIGVVLAFFRYIPYSCFDTW